ncbi:isoquinoline 1-oxidoreductase [Paramagnetospirillum kuznetsovii]|uniref:Isoquinoline 1-oxidoreductase n=1 Tax=Paramagnetospirillum kuznetsovii TaxID=2053833 RepID=A0A364P111_9PROT|nr:(2Fe-2S)-binding protein [Paramagnetospirillum kuznetsovii]RAU22986.1 isoquinoline 1-oxidoreductase [Paramagnetospirillum kuznetsovii]
MISLMINGERRKVDASPDMPLLWVLRDQLGLNFTRYGCGQGLCGACTILLDGEPVRACMTPVGELAGRRITTIHGLEGGVAKLVKAAWVELDVPQCGYCQAGQVLAATVLLRKNPKPSDADIDDALDGHLCRCGTYRRIRAAIHLAASRLGGAP